MLLLVALFYSFLWLNNIPSCVYVYMCEVKVAQLYLTLCNPMDYKVHGILPARVLEWVAVPFSRGSSQTRGQTHVSSKLMSAYIAGRQILTSWATRESCFSIHLSVNEPLVCFHVLAIVNSAAMNIEVHVPFCILKNRDITLPTKVFLVKAMVSPVVMYGCESWTIKKAEHRRIDAFELWCLRRLLSPLDSKEIQLVHPKGNQSWIFTGRTDAEAEIPILWPPDGKNWLIWKDPDAGKDWRWEEKRTTEDEMVEWHHWLNGREFE